MNDIGFIPVPIRAGIEPSPVIHVSLIPVVVGPIPDILVVSLTAKRADRDVDLIVVFSGASDGLGYIRSTRVWTDKFHLYHVHVLSSGSTWNYRLNLIPVKRHTVGAGNNKQADGRKKQCDNYCLFHLPAPSSVL
jgi:hypothetical protein